MADELEETNSRSTSSPYEKKRRLETTIQQGAEIIRSKKLSSKVLHKLKKKLEEPNEQGAGLDLKKKSQLLCEYYFELFLIKKLGTSSYTQCATKHRKWVNLR